MKLSEILIQPYSQDSDLEQIVDIWFEASLIAHPFIGAERLTAQKQLIKEVYLPQAETWVAVSAGQPIGFISLLGDVVGGLFISPAWQGRGIGRKLIDHAIRLRGGLSLEVYLENQNAVDFYHALGFRETARRELDDLGFPFPNATLQLTPGLE